MKTPKTIKALAIVEGNNPKLDIYDTFSVKNASDMALEKGEKVCEVEVKFIKYINK